MKHIIFILLVLFILPFNGIAQKNQDSIKLKSEFWKNVHYGGGLQLSIGNSYTAIGISPSAIYEFSDKWAAGIGVSYLYVNNKLFRGNSNVFSGSTLLLYNPIKELQINTEFELMNINQKNEFDSSNYWNPAWYVGLGYAIGKHGAIGIRYDLLWKENKSIYNEAFTPYVRVYF